MPRRSDRRLAGHFVPKFLTGLHHGREHTSAELAELFSVARSTVYRALHRARRDAGAIDAA